MDWRHRAACRGRDAELFFPAGDTGPALAQVEEAKAVCAGCAVRADCLDYALAALPDGIAGGLTAAERRALRRAGHRGSRAVPAAVAAAELEIEPPGRSAAERRAASVAALRAGSPVARVATVCGVSDRTVQRWAHQLRADQQPARTG